MALNSQLLTVQNLTNDGQLHFVSFSFHYYCSILRSLNVCIRRDYGQFWIAVSERTWSNCVLSLLCPAPGSSHLISTQPLILGYLFQLWIRWKIVYWFWIIIFSPNKTLLSKRLAFRKKDNQMNVSTFSFWNLKFKRNLWFQYFFLLIVC